MQPFEHLDQVNTSEEPSKNGPFPALLLAIRTAQHAEETYRTPQSAQGSASANETFATSSHPSVEEVQEHADSIRDETKVKLKYTLRWKQTIQTTTNELFKHVQGRHNRSELIKASQHTEGLQHAWAYYGNVLDITQACGVPENLREDWTLARKAASETKRLSISKLPSLPSHGSVQAYPQFWRKVGSDGPLCVISQIGVQAAPGMTPETVDWDKDIDWPRSKIKPDLSLALWPHEQVNISAATKDSKSTLQPYLKAVRKEADSTEQASQRIAACHHGQGAGNVAKLEALDRILKSFRLSLAETSRIWGQDTVDKCMEEVKQIKTKYVRDWTKVECKAFDAITLHSISLALGDAFTFGDISHELVRMMDKNTIQYFERFRDEYRVLQIESEEQSQNLWIEATKEAEKEASSPPKSVANLVERAKARRACTAAAEAKKQKKRDRKKQNRKNKKNLMKPSVDSALDTLAGQESTARSLHTAHDADEGAAEEDPASPDLIWQDSGAVDHTTKPADPSPSGFNSDDDAQRFPPDELSSERLAMADSDNQDPEDGDDMAKRISDLSTVFANLEALNPRRAPTFHCEPHHSSQDFDLPATLNRRFSLSEERKDARERKDDIELYSDT